MNSKYGDGHRTAHGRRGDSGQATVSIVDVASECQAESGNADEIMTSTTIRSPASAAGSVDLYVVAADESFIDHLSRIMRDDIVEILSVQENRNGRNTHDRLQGKAAKKIVVDALKGGANFALGCFLSRLGLKLRIDDTARVRLAPVSGATDWTAMPSSASSASLRVRPYAP